MQASRIAKSFNDYAKTKILYNLDKIDFFASHLDSSISSRVKELSQELRDLIEDAENDK